MDYVISWQHVVLLLVLTAESSKESEENNCSYKLSCTARNWWSMQRTGR